MDLLLNILQEMEWLILHTMPGTHSHHILLKANLSFQEKQITLGKMNNETSQLMSCGFSLLFWTRAAF